MTLTLQSLHFEVHAYTDMLLPLPAVLVEWLNATTDRPYTAPYHVSWDSEGTISGITIT
jgi:hypothetical protein